MQLKKKSALCSKAEKSTSEFVKVVFFPCYMRIRSLSSFYVQQLYQNSNHPFISGTIFVPTSTINKSCNKNKIFSMTYLNSFAECCVRETEARKNVDHLAIKTHSAVLKSSAHAVLLAVSFYNACLLLKCCKCTLQHHSVITLFGGWDR